MPLNSLEHRYTVTLCDHVMRIIIGRELTGQ